MGLKWVLLYLGVVQVFERAPVHRSYTGLLWVDRDTGFNKRIGEMSP